MDFQDTLYNVEFANSGESHDVPLSALRDGVVDFLDLGMLGLNEIPASLYALDHL